MEYFTISVKSVKIVLLWKFFFRTSLTWLLHLKKPCDFQTRSFKLTLALPFVGYSFFGSKNTINMWIQVQTCALNKVKWKHSTYWIHASFLNKFWFVKFKQQYSYQQIRAYSKEFFVLTKDPLKHRYILVFHKYTYTLLTVGFRRL